MFFENFLKQITNLLWFVNDDPNCRLNNFGNTLVMNDRRVLLVRVGYIE